MNKMQEVLLEKNIIIITGNLTADTLSYVHEAIVHLLLKPITDITVVISTGGGNNGMEIYDALALYPGKKIGLVVNYAQSAGALVLQACDQRLATPHSKILIHHGTTGEVKYDILMDPKRTEQFILDSRNLIEAKYKIFMSRTKRTREEVSTLCFQDRNLSPEEAIEFGLIDRIWSGSLPISETGLHWEQQT